MTTAATAHLSPASAAGIVFQVHRMLTHLVREHRAERVGFELFDDVTREELDGTRLVEQDKLEPLTDESESLWKTLHNWIHTFRSLSPEEQAKTRFCVVTKARTPVRSPLVLKLALPSKTPADVDEALELLSNARADRKQRRAANAAKSPPTSRPPKQDDIDEYMRFVLESKPEEQRAIVGGMSIVFGSDPVTDAHREDLRRALFLLDEEDGERVLNTALGWLTTNLLQFVGKKQDCWIIRDDFARQLYESRLVNPSMPRRLRGQREIPEAERQRAPRNTARLYEKRLREVAISESAVRMATERYLAHRAELLHLTTSGSILSTRGGSYRSDQDLYYDRLHDGWTTLYRRVCDYPPSDPAAAGRQLFYGVLDRARAQQLKIGRIEVSDEYFIEGGYHALANQDHHDAEVWWLPATAEKPAVDSEGDE